MAASEVNVDPIECSVQPLDIAFHPKRQNLVAAALVDGTLEVHDFSNNTDNDSENDTIVSSIPLHTQLLPSKQEGGAPHEASCRTVLFSCDGTRIYTGGSGGDVCGMDAEVACSFGSTTNKPLWRVSGGEKYGGIHSMHQLLPTSPTGPLLVTGSEEGCVRLWDERLCGPCNNNRQKRGMPRGCVLSWEDQYTDYISDFANSTDGNTLLASSADCTLGVFDLRKATRPEERREALRRSDDQEDELLSVEILKNGRKVVCGTQEGVLAVWSWGVWGDVSDRFPGHPSSIDALLKVDEDTVLTGSSDGLLRLVQIQPDKLLGVLGDHDGFPIEKLKYNANKSHVGSVSHDTLIRLWNATVLQDNDEDDEEEGDHQERDLPFTPATAVARAPMAAVGHESDDDWEDMDADDNMDDSSSDDSDDSDEGQNDTTNDRRARKLKSDNEKFFEDL